MLQLRTNPETGIAKHDFCGAAFDNSVPATSPPRALYVLLSTPRSGSTWLCSELFNRTGLIAHEYLQHHQYLPHLAKRFGVACETHGAQGSTLDVDLTDYYEALIRWRSHHGVLGINAHVSHLPVLRAFLVIFHRRNPDGQILIDYLSRRDKYRQAASLVIARKNRQWSETTDSTPHADGALPRSLQQWMLILDAAKAYRQIIRQDNAMMMQSNPLKPHQVVAYEDLVAGGMEAYITNLMLRLELPPAQMLDVPQLALQKQSGPLNAAIAERLRRWQPLLEVASQLAAPARALAGWVRRRVQRRPRQLLRLY